MGQEFSSDALISNNNSEFTFPQWVKQDCIVTHSTISICKSSIAALMTGDYVTFKRIKAFGCTSSPLDFFYRQVFYRLAILSPSMIRRVLHIDENYHGTMRTSNILQTEPAKMFFNNLVSGAIMKLYALTNQDDILNGITEIVTYYNSTYGICSSLLSDIAYIIISVLSDCLGTAFEVSKSCWIDLFSKEIQILDELDLSSNLYIPFSLRDTMKQLNQPYIDWCDGILSTGYAPVDSQHQWLVTIVNISFYKPQYLLFLNNEHINSYALSDYACIHFREEENLFFNNMQYEEKNYHKNQHDNFLIAINKMKQNIGVVDINVLSKQVLDYVLSWLTQHSRVTDKKMVECCLSPEYLGQNRYGTNP